MVKCIAIFLLLVKNAGFINIGEKVVRHQARKYGKTKFGMERFINGFLDLNYHLVCVSKFGKRPMHFLRGIGSLIMLCYWFCICHIFRHR